VNLVMLMNNSMTNEHDEQPSPPTRTHKRSVHVRQISVIMHDVYGITDRDVEVLKSTFRGDIGTSSHHQ
jgi:hypothetical protein